MNTAKKLFYYCDCPRNAAQRKQYSKNNRVKMQLTTCNEEGICDHCGYYAFASNTEEKSNGLYRKMHGPEIVYAEKLKKENENGAGRWQDFYEEYSLGN
jgi:hypothetical protein